MPSAAMNFLAKYSTSGLEGAFEEVREKFNGGKVQLVKWEQGLKDAREQGLNDSLDKFKQVTDSIDASRQVKGLGEMALSITPSMAEVAVGASGATGDPFSILPGLASIGHELSKLISGWRKRSRLTYINRTRKDAQEVKDHTTLMKKAFDTSFTRDQIDRFVRLSDCIDNLIVEPK